MKKTNYLYLLPVVGLNIALSACNSGGSGGSGTNSSNNVESALANILVASSDNTVSTCSIGTEGQVFNCVKNTGFNMPFKVARLNGGSAYVSNPPIGQISLCSLDVNGSLSNCVSADTSSTDFFWPKGMLVNESYAYVANAGYNSVSKCSYNSSGLIDGCENASGYVSGVTNLAKNNGYMYLVGTTTSTSGFVEVCKIGKDGYLDDCKSTGNSFNSPLGIVIKNNIAYVTDTIGNGNVYMCGVNSSTGILSNCQVTGSNFNNPVSIEAFESYMYVSNKSSNNLTVCQISTNGALTNCMQTGSFYQPNDVTIISN